MRMRDAILEEGGQGDCECWKMSILRRAKMFDVRLERSWGQGFGQRPCLCRHTKWSVVLQLAVGDHSVVCWGRGETVVIGC